MTATQHLSPEGHPIWELPGGLHIPDMKRQSCEREVTDSAVPRRLVIPMQQHIGQGCGALVEVGERVLKGQKIADSSGKVSAPVHASSSGTVVEVGDHPIPHASALPAPCIVIETDGKDEWCAPMPPLANYKELDQGTLVERIREAGIVGLGGAAFPSSVKLTPGSERQIHTLIINGAECEPYITCDDMLMRERGEQILRGAQIMLHLLAAQSCMVGVEDNKPEAARAMRRAVEQLGCEDQIKVVTIPTRYPSGGEKQLIHILTGREVPSGGLPADIGMVCHNVATAAAIADAVLQGRPLVERMVTLTGEGIAEPRNMRVRIGTLIEELVGQAGGYSGRGWKMILGGPMMGITLPNDQFPITKAANCVLVPSEAEAPSPQPALPCIRCGRCAEVCPMDLLPQQMYWHIRAKNGDKVREYNIWDCIECGCCSHVCPSHIPLVQYYRFAKADLRAKDLETLRSERARQRSEAREARLARQEAEKKARLAAKKAAAKAKPKAAGATASGASSDGDAKKAAIEAARKRAAEKRARLKQEGVEPKNTQNLKAFQQRQVETADKRRADAEKEAQAMGGAQE
jgi:electron transport complex protein RnfC